MLQMIPDPQTEYLKDPVPDLFKDEMWFIRLPVPPATAPTLAKLEGSCPGDYR